MQNSITREITVKAAKERVFQAITDPAQIVQWFPNQVEGKIAKGERPIFDFGEHGKNQVYIEDVSPFTYFAYRWIPGSDHFIGDVLTKAHTLVEFMLEEVAEGTKVTLKESGFADLPAEIAEKCFKDNSGGWEYMMGRLSTLLTKGA